MRRKLIQTKIDSYVEREQLTSLMNNTKWEKLISEIREIEDFVPQHRQKSIFSEEYVAPWDGEFYYHLRPFNELEWIEIRANPHDLSVSEEAARETLKGVLLACRVPFSLENGYLRIWGYLRKGSSPIFCE